MIRYVIFKRVFDCPHRSDAVHQRAHAADALRKGPGIARVSATQDDLNAANHGAGRPRLGNLIAIHLCFDSQMALDSGYRIYDYSFVHGLTYSVC
jgi:hypothetical protein